MTAEVAVPGRARVGEGPVWDAGRLHWVDIPAGRLHTSDPATGHTTSVELPTLLGAAAPRRGGGFVAATAEGFASVGSDGTMTVRRAILPDGERMNDAKCDRHGRFWAGSTSMDFRPGKGALHVLMPDWTSRVVLDDLALPNGLDWSPDGRTFYLADSIAGEISAFDTEPGSTSISRRRTLFRVPARTGMPDGLTVDAAGCLWVAIWGGDRLARISPDGDLLGEIPMPVHQPSSCAFGGARLDRLYVTSAREGLDLPDDDPAGSVFVLDRPGVVGRPATAFAG
ncbi:SMP-30/gluconolactonase/LRE family protein [Nonomuraea sp. MG754425]|uniref:SMP-30/gluconolactonase/LRE family protein n=1 Tax=Nonomuraea sp. MG754425 TaxID=2570319 RepID=UPI001F2925AC|nr:SMP-30/gluconolactonase/LRE family protein [Nonomuraea sp. MG754425]MCF6470873.1 SMP-30/gluconolactonase/LRE family protein [Nonomuraea sp. MG754425]